MKKVNQTLVDIGFGNCNQAAIASLFDLELSMVPNFILYSEKTWVGIFNSFVWSIGWEWVGTGYPKPKDKPDDRHKDHRHELTNGYDVNGYIDASVNSKTFKNSTHSVIIDLNGIVVHDPNPNKLWEGINIQETGDLRWWTLFKKRKDFEHKKLNRYTDSNN